MCVSVLVTHLALGEGVAHRADFGFGKTFVDVAPKGFHCHLDLGNRQQRALDSLPFAVAHAAAVVVDILGQIEFAVQPVSVAHGVAVVEQFGIFGGS